MAGFPRAGDEYGGRYRIVRELGHGGMGIVYEAVDTVLDRSVALKIVLPSLPAREDYRARFAREASVLARIRSRHIVGIHEYGEHEDTVYFVTELFPDGDLRTWLAENGPLDRRAALLLVAQVCEALADAHAVHVVHRDVKPGNVLLWNRSEGLIPYLCDFGIATDGKQGLTRTGALVGSPAYMAPERHFGHPADERGDVYSVGCLLWAVLTGDAPYSGTDFQMMNSHINEPTPQLATGHPVDRRIDQILAAAMQKDPQRRIATADEVRSRLLAIVRELDARVSPGASAAGQPAPVVAGGGEDRRGRGPWLVAAAAVVLLAGTVAAAVGLSGPDAPATAGDPETSEAGEAAVASTGPSQALAAPAAPEPPRVRATRGYRSVRFAVTVPESAAAPVHVERLTDDGWQRVRRIVSVDTRRGGLQACARFRTVAATGSGEVVASQPRRVCGRSEAPTVRFVRNTADACVNSIGGPCTWYDVAVTGFPSNVSPLVTVRRAGGGAWCTDCDWDRIEVGADGRGYLPRDWKISRDEGRVILDVAGVTGRFHVFF